MAEESWEMLDAYGLALEDMADESDDSEDWENAFDWNKEEEV